MASGGGATVPVMGKVRVLLVALAGVLGAALGGLGVVLVVVPLALALAWELGRGYEARMMRAGGHAAAACEAFSAWAEQVLAETAEEPGR